MTLINDRIKTDSMNRLVLDGLLVDAGTPLDLKEGGRKFRVAFESSSGRHKEEKPEKIVLDGEWSLDKEHNLKLHVLASDKPFLSGKTIIFKGDIECPGPDTFTFRVREHDSITGLRSGSIRLKGRWRADKNNRLAFEAGRSSGRYDVLTLQGAWQLNKSNELIYKYSKTGLKRSDKEEKLLVFRGYWGLCGGKLRYKFERSSDSFFEFRYISGPVRLAASKDKIRFTAGISYKKDNMRKDVRRIITIFGKWSVEKDMKVSFSVRYSGYVRKKIYFGIEKMTGDSEKMTLYLTDEDGKKLGIAVEFRKAFKSDAELFLALGRSGKESRIIGGVKVKF